MKSGSSDEEEMVEVVEEIEVPDDPIEKVEVNTPKVVEDSEQ